MINITVGGIDAVLRETYTLYLFNKDTFMKTEIYFKFVVKIIIVMKE